MTRAHLDAPCPQCHEDTLSAVVVSASHNATTLDIVVECQADEGGCGHRLNGFMSLSEMMVLEGDE